MQDKASRYPQRIYLCNMEVSSAYGKLLTALHRLHNVSKGNIEDANHVENAIYALEAIPALRQYLNDKYPLPKIIEK